MDFLNIAKSGTLALNEKMQTAVSQGETVYKFGFGESPFLPPQRVQDALIAASHRKDYTPVAGLPELREKIASFHSEVDGYPINANQVLVAPGTKPLLYNLMHAFTGANVFLPAPSWVSYAPQAKIAGHNIHQIYTDDRWRVTPIHLEIALSNHSQPDKTNLMVLNYPGNPDGLTYSRQELEALAEVMRKYNVWVISDEIYGLLHHQGQHVSLASIYPERTMVTTGLSKWCGAGGWRLGALILPPNAPDGLYDAMIGLGSEVYSCAPAPIQVAGLSAYELDEDVHQFLSGQRKVLSVIGQRIYQSLIDIGVSVNPPEGAFYLLLDFSELSETLRQHNIVSSVQLCEALFDETQVTLLPGVAFGLPSYSYTARLAYVDFDGVSALQDVALLETEPDVFLSKYASKMLDGIARMGDWLNQLAEEQ